MFIHEAVKKALKEKGGIYRKKYIEVFGKKLYVMPTNGYATCYLRIEGEKPNPRGRNWNPTAEDLAADDWEVFKE